MHRSDFVPVSTNSLMRSKFDAIGKHMEQMMGKDFFVCDAVLDTNQRQIAVFAGKADLVQQASWKVADKRTYVHWLRRNMMSWFSGCPKHSITAMGWNQPDPDAAGNLGPDQSGISAFLSDNPSSSAAPPATDTFMTRSSLLSRNLRAVPEELCQYTAEIERFGESMSSARNILTPYRRIWVSSFHASP